ncbi:hypothetical protein TSUD_170720 [Trifolium subterraneum]|uniref:Uncharacterized protein n=1 Tax=Trifolium subterraneum TaxID=3900 RepID=A0A2Z6LSG3_TRISU|nr:hypothetical protein TSUD_170720 [Trifolium subterraneum]
MIIQSLANYYNDCNHLHYGCSCPFIFFGAIAVTIIVFLISYVVDLGHSLEDDLREKRKQDLVLYLSLFWTSGYWTSPIIYYRDHLMPSLATSPSVIIVK